MSNQKQSEGERGAPSLRLTADLVSHHMNMIAECFKPGAKITVIVRRPNEPTQDFMMTNDDLPELRAVLDRREADLKKAESK